MFKYIISSIYLIFYMSAPLAGNVEELFSDGVFEQKWGTNIEALTSSITGGEVVKKYGLTYYSTNDGRELFGINRENSNYINYYFDSNNKLNSVAIQFPMSSADDFGNLLLKLNTIFGKHITPFPQPLGGTMVTWPEESGITLSLTTIVAIFGSNDLIFGISYNSEPDKDSKKALGF